MSNSGVDLSVADPGYQHHFYRQIIHEGVIDDQEYLQHIMKFIVAKAETDLTERGLEREGAGLVGRQVEVVVVTRCYGEA